VTSIQLGLGEFVESKRSRWANDEGMKIARRFLPLHSKLVREIRSHMTPMERSRMFWQSMGYILWMMLTFPLPLAVTLGSFRRGADPYSLAIFAPVLIGVFIGTLPLWVEAQRELLASTRWAREQGITAEQIRAFGRENS
jgi:hypothetical protein